MYICTYVHLSTFVQIYYIFIYRICSFLFCLGLLLFKNRKYLHINTIVQKLLDSFVCRTIQIF